MEEPARIAPLVYYALWTALSRYDLEYFRELKDKCRLTLQAVERTKDVSELSAIPVSELRDDLLESEFYGDTVRFAGEVAFDDIAQELSRVKLHPRQRSLRDALSFLGSLLPQTQFQIEKVGRGHIFHCRNSAFVRSGCVRATCGFISGFVSAWMTWSGHSRARAEESVCMSLAPEARFCVFELK